MIDYERFDYEIDEPAAPVYCCRCHDYHDPSCLADTQDDHYEEMEEEGWDKTFIPNSWICPHCQKELMEMPEEQLDAEVDRLWPDETVTA